MSDSKRVGWVETVFHLGRIVEDRARVSHPGDMGKFLSMIKPGHKHVGYVYDAGWVATEPFDSLATSVPVELVWA